MNPRDELDLSQWMELLEERRSEGDWAGVEQLLRSGLERWPDEARLEIMLGELVLELGRYEEAEALLRGVLIRHPGEVDCRATLSHLLLVQMEYEEALKMAQRCLSDAPAHPEASYVRGLLRERKGDSAGARRDFLRAWYGQPEVWPLPVLMEQETIDELIEETLATMTEDLQREFRQLAILIEDFPSADFLAQYDPPIHPTEILGYFSGPTLMERSLENPWSQFPAKVVIFHRNLEKHAHSYQDLVEELRVTLLHELGHYLGLDEDDLEERGLN